VILVGAEGFSQEDRQKVDVALATMSSIYSAIGLTLSIKRFKLTGPKLRGRNKSPINEADLEAITRLAEGPDGTIDIFVVRLMMGLLGLSPIRGPCNKRKKGMKGVVVAVEIPIRNDHPVTNPDAFRGAVWAHELGHYLGLEHCRCTDLPCFGNLMRGGECTPADGTTISPTQAATIARHCAVTP
jgi:hypothetical protein